MKELILTFLLLVITLGLIALTKYFIEGRKKEKTYPMLDITLYYDGDAGFEPLFARIIRSKTFCSLNVNLYVVDLVSDEQSRKWLEALSRKTDTCFVIIEK